MMPEVINAERDEHTDRHTDRQRVMENERGASQMAQLNNDAVRTPTFAATEFCFSRHNTTVTIFVTRIRFDHPQTVKPECFPNLTGSEADLHFRLGEFNLCPALRRYQM